MIVSVDETEETITASGSASWPASGGSFSFALVDVTKDYTGLVGNVFVISKSSNITRVNSVSYSNGAIVINATVTANGTASIVLKISFASTSQTTWSPYSNICPISGWTEVEIEHRGKNFVDSALYEFTERIFNGLIYTVQNDGTIKVNGTPSSIGGPGLTKRFLLPPGTYTYFEAKEQDIFCTYRYAMQQNGGSTYPLRSPFISTGKEWFYVNLYCEQIKKYDNVILYPQIEFGSAATDYEPYTGNQISVTFPTTIYGGNDEVIGGTLVDNYGQIVINDQTSFAVSFPDNQNTCKIQIVNASIVPAMKPNNTTKITILADSLKVYAPDYVYTHDVEGVSENKDSSSAGFWIRINKSRLAENTKNGVLAYLAQNPIQVVYLLAEPVEYTLAGNEMTALYGTNNIWSNIGDITVKIAEKGITAFELAPHT